MGHGAGSILPSETSQFHLQSSHHLTQDPSQSFTKPYPPDTCSLLGPAFYAILPQHTAASSTTVIWKFLLLPTTWIKHILTAILTLFSTSLPYLPHTHRKLLLQPTTWKIHKLTTILTLYSTPLPYLPILTSHQFRTSSWPSPSSYPHPYAYRTQDQFPTFFQQQHTTVPTFHSNPKPTSYKLRTNSWPFPSSNPHPYTYSS